MKSERRRIIMAKIMAGENESGEESW
jgi:hypothetical protein